MTASALAALAAGAARRSVVRSGTAFEFDRADAACEACRLCQGPQMWGVSVTDFDFVVALAGCPNVGKSTVFNALTGMRQHTGNWPGKTVARAEGSFSAEDRRFKLVDLPGVYTLISSQAEERLAHDAIVFGQPDVTVVVVDASQLERNLSFVLQVLEVTDDVVVCLNLIDEAARHGLRIDVEALSRELGVPVIPTAARWGRGIPELIDAIAAVAGGKVKPRPRHFTHVDSEVTALVHRVGDRIAADWPGVPAAHWIALHLLDGDAPLSAAVREGQLAELLPAPTDDPARRGEELVRWVRQQRAGFAGDFHELVVGAVHREASRIFEATSSRSWKRLRLDTTLDRIVTSRWLGFPFMLALFTLTLWITIAGANVPSAMLASLLLDTAHPVLKSLGETAGMPWWLNGFLFDGVYLGTAWVISVMLPPMAIFFPLFTLLEDFGYLARIAFNLDYLFARVGAHGKQALTMSMGFGCNAAGVIATRIIDSPRERLIAIITNNFALCNGRWPTQIMIATVFVGAAAPPALAGLVSASAVVGVAVLGIVLTFLVSALLSRTVLRGETSVFSLELPPYRRPRILSTLYTSLIDRTAFVLWRAVVFAMPAGGLIWLSSNIVVGDASVAEHLIRMLDPIGWFLGLNGVILLAYVLAIPANEIVIPTVLMLTALTANVSGVGAGAGVMFELDSGDAIASLLVRGGGWGLLTAVNLMLFSLIHNPCSTTIYTIYKETGSARWTALATLLPVLLGFATTAAVALVWRSLA